MCMCAQEANVRGDAGIFAYLSDTKKIAADNPPDQCIQKPEAAEDP